MMIDTTYAVAQEQPWSPWRDTALGLSAEAHLLAGDTDTATALFIESARRRRRSGTPTWSSSRSWRSFAIDRRAVVGAAEHVANGLGAIESSPDAGLRRRPCSSSRRRLAWPCTAATRRGKPAADPGDARPPVMHLRDPLVGGAGACAARQGVLDDRRLTTARHLLREIDDVVPTDRRSAPSSPRSRRSARDAGVERRRDVAVRRSSPAELRLLPYLQTHLTFREIGERLFVSRNTVSSQVSSIYRKLGVSSRADAVQRASDAGLIGT